MKYLSIILLLSFCLLARFSFSQVDDQTLHCLIPADISLDSLITNTINQMPGLTQQEKERRIGSYTLQQLERFKGAMKYTISEDFNTYERIVSTQIGYDLLRRIKTDLRNGEIREDTISSPKSYRAAPSLSLRVEKAPLIVEAERIKKTGGYKTKWGVKTSHIFRINKIFKGQTTRDTFEIPQTGGEVNGEFMIASHALSIPEKGIFFLNDVPEPSLYKSEDSLFHYPIKYNTSTPLSYSKIGSKNAPFWALNIEGRLYPKLEELTGQHYRRIFDAPLKDTMIINWLNKIFPDLMPILNSQSPKQCPI